MTYAPLLVTVIGIVVSFIKMVSVLKSVMKDNQDQFEDLKAQYRTVLQDNANLRKNLNELITKIDKVKKE